MDKLSFESMSFPDHICSQNSLLHNAKPLANSIVDNLMGRNGKVIKHLGSEDFFVRSES